MQSKRPTILIVEDDPVAAHELRADLVDCGYTVPATARTLGDALAATAGGGIDLVLMDIQLDGAGDGVEAGKLIHERHGVPVVYVTVTSDEAVIARARATAPYGFLVKPVRRRELQSAVEIALARRSAEQQARAGWLSTVVQCIGDGVIAADVEGRVELMNRAAEALTGWTLADARGEPVEDVVALVDDAGAPLESHVRTVLAERRPSAALDARLTRRDGSTAAIESTSAPVVGDDGALLGVVLVFRDASERRRAQSSQLIADRLASIGLLAAGLSHELATPLAVVAANLDIVASSLEDAALRDPELDETREALADAVSASTKLRAIVRDLKLFSRSSRGAGNPVPLDVHQVLESTLRLTRSELHHRARVVTNLAATPRIVADEGRFRQVLLNLLVNAAQGIDARGAEGAEIRVSAGTDDLGRAFVEIADTGAGIAEESVENLYQPFFPAKGAGLHTGLGLHLCRQIVAEMHGELEITSTRGAGTVARVTMPREGGTDPRS
jgi:two-component system, cell cycle sensor histidine kinase and response regulator CckA